MSIDLRYGRWWQCTATALFTNITLCLGQRISDRKGKESESVEEDIGDFIGIDLEKNNNLLILVLSVVILLIFIVVVMIMTIYKRKGCLRPIAPPTTVAVTQASGTRPCDCSDLPPSYCHCVREGIITSSDSFVEGLWGIDCDNYLPDYETIVAERWMSGIAGAAALPRNDSVSDAGSDISASSMSILIRETSEENWKPEQPRNLESNIAIDDVDSVHEHLTIVVPDNDIYQHDAYDAIAEHVAYLDSVPMETECDLINK